MCVYIWCSLVNDDWMMHIYVIFVHCSQWIPYFYYRHHHYIYLTNGKNLGVSECEQSSCACATAFEFIKKLVIYTCLHNDCFIWSHWNSYIYTYNNWTVEWRLVNRLKIVCKCAFLRSHSFCLSLSFAFLLSSRVKDMHVCCASVSCELFSIFMGDQLECTHIDLLTEWLTDWLRDLFWCE